MYLTDQMDNDNLIDTLTGVRGVIEQSTLDPAPFEFSEVFLFTEQVHAAYNHNGDTITTWGNVVQYSFGFENDWAEQKPEGTKGVRTSLCMMMARRST